MSDIEDRLASIETHARGVRLGIEAILAAQQASDDAHKAADQRVRRLEKVTTHTDEGIKSVLKGIFQVDKRVAHLDDGVGEVRTGIRHLEKRIDVEAALAGTNVRLAQIEDQFSRFHKRLQMVLRRHDARRDGPQSESEGAFLIAATQVVETQRSLLGYDRLQVLWQAALNVAVLDLPVAEVGTYRGGSARFLAEALRHAGYPETPIHVFDTFAGHPAEKITEVDEEHTAGLFGDVTAEDVRAYLSAYPSVQVHEGEFSQQASAVADLQFSLVHADVDTYASTLDCLAFFTPRLVAGGVLVVDDFRSEKCPGVAQAVADFAELASSYQAWDVNTEQLVLVRRPASPDAGANGKSRRERSSSRGAVPGA